MPKGRGRGKAQKRSTDLPDPVQNKRRRTPDDNVSFTEQTQPGRSGCRSSSRRSNERDTDNSNTAQQEFVDPRKIILGKGKNNNATPNDKQDEAKAKNNDKTSYGDLVPEDPGRELDYEENLDVQVTVTGNVEQTTEDGEGDDESTLLSMIRTNPKLKMIFRRLIHDEQTTEKQMETDQPQGAERSATEELPTQQQGKKINKSMSDSTIYVPALVQRDPDMQGNSPILRNHVNMHGGVPTTPVNQITNF